MTAVVSGLMLWSANEVDRISRERDQAIVSLVVSQMMDRVAHTQESSTVWDDAVRKLRERPLDLDWLDINLGVWFKDYAGHDEVYILDPHGAPLYAMQGGRRTSPASYRTVSKAIDPLVRELRHSTEPTPGGHREPKMLSPGVADLATIHGRPAIVSVKPVVTDSGKLVQRPGTEAVHVSVVYLDDQFVGSLSEEYGLKGDRISAWANPRFSEAVVPLRKRNGDAISYFVWQPFAPGAAVIANVAPVLLIALLLAGVIVFMLAQRLGRKTMDLEASKAQAQHLALHDVLTGLPNRALFEQRLDRTLARCRRDGSRLALLYLDLDRFKQVNDTLGHPAGDALIREVARRLTAGMRTYDTVARIGGDEFAIILVDPGDRWATETICGRIVEELGRPFELMGVQSFVGASVGVVVAPIDGDDCNELTRKADIALYKAKLDGRSRFTFFSPEMDEAVRLRDEINRDLRNAIADPDRQLKVFYQPVFSSRTGAMTAVEALLRWEHPDKGLVGPAAFISLAEESGMIEVLGEWVLRTAVRDASKWQGLRLAVNVSPLQVRSRSFADAVIGILAEANMAPNRLELEITETALMERSTEVHETLARLRAHGIVVALDDFGTGYSSLSHIRDIAVDRIKIDRSFVTAIDTGRGAALIQAIVALAHANGLQLTAEGVETWRQRNFLQNVGCEELQGYLLSRPIAAAEVAGLQMASRRATKIAPEAA